MSCIGDQPPGLHEPMQRIAVESVGCGHTRWLDLPGAEASNGVKTPGLLLQDEGSSPSAQPELPTITKAQSAFAGSKDFLFAGISIDAIANGLVSFLRW